MPGNKLTIAELVEAHFDNALNIETVGDIRIRVTNEPDYSAASFTVQAEGTRKSGEPLFNSKDFTLEYIQLVLVANGAQQSASGKLTASMVLAGIAFDVTVTLSRQVESFELVASLGQTVTVAALADALSSKPAALPKGLAKLRLGQFTATLQAGEMPSASVGALLLDNWQIPIAGRRLPASGQGSLQVGSKWKGDKKKLKLDNASLRVDLALTKQCVFDLSYEIGPKLNDLSGSWSSQDHSLLEFPALCRSLGIDMPDVSLPQALAFSHVDLSLDFASQRVQMAGENRDGQQMFGLLDKLLADNFGAAMGVAMQPGWRLGDLSRDLASIDFLAFRQAFVAVATATVAVDASCFSALGEESFALTSGLNFGADIELGTAQDSDLAKALYLVLGRQDLFLQGCISPNPVNDVFSAALPAGDIHIPIPPAAGTKAKAKLILGKPRLTIHPAPQAAFIAVSGDIRIPIKRGRDIDLNGSLAIGADQLSVIGNLDVSQLSPPPGTQGMELENVGFSLGVAPEGVTAGFAGDMIVGKACSEDKFSFELAFPEFTPVFLYARFTALNLGDFFKPLCPDGKLPPAFSKGVRLDDVLLYWCIDGGGCMLPDKQKTVLLPGFAIHGKVDLFGFNTRGQLDVTDSRIGGDLFLDPIRISVAGMQVFSLTDTTGKKGAHVDFGTDGGGRMDLSYRFDLLGVVEQAGLKFNKGKLVLDYGLALGKGLSARVDFSLDSRLRFSLGVKGRFSKKKPLSFGKAHITALDVSFDTRKGRFEADVGGFYSTPVGNVPFHKPVTVTLHDIGGRLERLAGQIAREL